MKTPTGDEDVPDARSPSFVCYCNTQRRGTTPETEKKRDFLSVLFFFFSPFSLCHWLARENDWGVLFFYSELFYLLCHILGYVYTAHTYTVYTDR